MPIVSDSLSLYLAEIRKFSVLSEEDEHRYAVKFFEEKDLEAAHTLITSNLRFVVKVAGEYRHYGLKMIDLIQEGNIGLMMAVRKFNPYKGIRLISYAVWWIRAYIQNHVMSMWSLLKIGTTQAQRKLFFKLKETKNALLKMNDGEDDAHSAALALNVSDKEVAEMEQRLQGDYSLDAELSCGDGLTALEGLADERHESGGSPGGMSGKPAAAAKGGAGGCGLNEKERFIIERRITSDEPMTLQEIATHFSISRERVRQIEEGALKKVKNSLLPLLSAA